MTLNAKKSGEQPTGVAQIILKDGDNCIVVDPGVNFDITPEDIVMAEDDIKNCDMVVMQLEIPQDSVDYALDIAGKYGIRVLRNHAPARKLSNEFLKKIDIIPPNETEAEYLSGIKIDSVEEARKAVDFFRGKGIEQIIIIMGEKARYITAAR